MRISKLYLVVCAAALCGGVTAAQADDTPAQAAARAALEEQMRQANAQPESTNTQASTPAKPRPHTTAAKPAPATPPPAEKPAPVAAEKPAANTAPAAAEIQSARVAPKAKKTDRGLFSPVPPASGSNQVEMPAMNNEETTNIQTPSPSPEPKQQPQPQQQAKQQPEQQPAYSEQDQQNPNAYYWGKELGLKPVLPPPLPITSQQQAQLRALLEKYDANQISPEQYQAQRKKILAEH